MAAVDLARAKRIAESITGSLAQQTKSLCFGAMALALADSDKAAARELLDRAFEEVRRPSQNAWAKRQLFPVAVTLVGYAQRICPERTPDYFWQALSVYGGPASLMFGPVDQYAQAERDTETASLVILLGLYGQFRQLCRRLMEPIYQRAARQADALARYRYVTVYAAMALTDPERAIKFGRQFWTKLSPDDRKRSRQPWLTIANILSRSGPELADYIAEDVFHLVAIDEEDF